MVFKELDIKNRSNYFFDDLIWLHRFDPNLLKLDKKSLKDMNIYYIGYVTKKNVNLNLIIQELYGYVEEYNGSKYLATTLTGNNNQILTNYAKV